MAVSGTLLGRGFGLTAMVLLAADCRQDVPLPEVSPTLDASRADGRSRPGGEAGASGGNEDPLDGGLAEAGGGRPVCNGVGFRQFNPQVVLAMDRSSSMSDKSAGASSRFTILQNVLRPLIRTYREAIYFGYVEFPGATCQHGGTCCAGGFLRPSYDPLRLIERRWVCEGQTSCPTRTNEAPVGAALNESRQRYDDAEQTPATRHVLLFTDSEPSCGGPPDTQACDEAIKEVAELRGTQRVRTTVVALDAALKTSACLIDMAGVGSDNALFVAGDEASLRQQLEPYFKQLSGEACTFRLREPVVAPQRLLLTADRYIVPSDPARAEGWAFDSAADLTQFTVYGSWCDKIRTSQVDDVDAYVCNR